MNLEIIHRQPSSPVHHLPVLFIHGAWQGAWVWDEHILPWFAARGWDSFAVSLRGHGGSSVPGRISQVRLRDYVDDVQEAMTQIGRPAILVGHSLGGVVLRRLLVRQSVPRAVVLGSGSPSALRRVLAYVIRRHPGVALDMLRSRKSSSKELSRELFYSRHMPEEWLDRYLPRMGLESPRAMFDAMWFDPPSPDGVRRQLLFAGGELDRVFPPDDIRKTAAAWGADLTIIPEIGHDVLLEPNWEGAALRVEQWLSAPARSQTEGTGRD